MSLYTIGDLHLAIGNPSKKMDIFTGWENYEERLERNWNKLVDKDDTVVIAGDVSWAMKLEECHNDFEFLNNLNGRKIFVKGNHDLWWSTTKKVNTYFDEKQFGTLEILFNDCKTYEDINICGTRGWMFMDSNATEAEHQKIVSRETGRLKLSLEKADKNKETIVFFHYPPVYQEFVIEPFIELLKEYNVTKCYYGHIHAKGCNYAFNGVYEGIKFQLISADFMKFCPLFII